MSGKWNFLPGRGSYGYRLPVQGVQDRGGNGATILNLPDTVGYAVPEEYGAMFLKVREHLASEHIILSAHCHDDLGLAVANSLAAVRAEVGKSSDSEWNWRTRRECRAETRFVFLYNVMMKNERVDV